MRSTHAAMPKPDHAVGSMADVELAVTRRIRAAWFALKPAVNGAYVVPPSVEYSTESIVGAAAPKLTMPSLWQ